MARRTPRLGPGPTPASATGCGACASGCLPAEPEDPAYDFGPFRPIFRTRDEWAAELANRTVHGVLHLGWVADGDGGYFAQMAVLVLPNGRLGRAYLAGIAPLRHLIVYPQLMRSLDLARRNETAGPSRQGG